MKTSELVLIIFKKAQRDSWIRLNMEMYSLLINIIKLGLEFEEDELGEIYNTCRGGYWFGCSTNGHHQGDGIYSAACQWNDSAAKSYEKLFKRVPFLLNNNRVYVGFGFLYKGLRYEITGWNKDNTAITAVAYKELTYDQSRGWVKKGRKLLSLTREQWLIERKEMELA